ncbi:MAG: hypothetical protein CSA52_01860 [Gammaproteobacteria bacterium]|nr:MAG: hypothetical protein CSB48_12700 [Pseudomonadota bacterium]PIE38550.1 MAG: hypothetical protein CSA52_01860 [Gammaproteobacteria bacterium]
MQHASHFIIVLDLDESMTFCCYAAIIIVSSNYLGYVVAVALAGSIMAGLHNCEYLWLKIR